MGNSAAGDILNGWKQIASRLGVDPSTAQRWERERSLPVRRLPGIKGRVWAERVEINRWRAGQPAEALAAELVRQRPWRSVVGAAVLLVAVGLGAKLWLGLRKGPPADWRVTGDALVVMDAGGRELWRRPVPPGSLQRDPYGTDKPPIWFGDLDSDGKVETLFRTRAAVYCLSERGDERWRFEPGREISQFRVARMGREWLVVSLSPTHVAALDARGSLRSEYRHAGRLLHLAVADLDKDGAEEAIIAGMMPDRRRATLVVLDPQRLGTERAVVVLPRNCLEKADRMEGASVQELRAPPELLTLIVGKAGSYLIWEFDTKLRVSQVAPAAGFLQRHRELNHKHAEFGAAEIEELTQAVEVRWSKPER